MSIYIKIPIAPKSGYTQEGFAEDYLKTTGEIFVLNNIREEKAEDQMTGSSRITEAQVIELKSRWPMMKYYMDFPSKAEWTPKIEEDI